MFTVTVNNRQDELDNKRYRHSRCSKYSLHTTRVSLLHFVKLSCVLKDLFIHKRKMVPLFSASRCMHTALCKLDSAVHMTTLFWTLEFNLGNFSFSPAHDSACLRWQRRQGGDFSSVSMSSATMVRMTLPTISATRMPVISAPLASTVSYDSGSGSSSTHHKHERYTRWAKKVGPRTRDHNSVKFEPI